MSEINRDTISIGIDFRPIPVDVGDGKVWNFNPDPAPSELDVLFSALREIGAAGKKANSEDGDGEGSVEFGKGLGALKSALGGLLVEAKQRTEWNKQPYGIGVMNALSNVLVEQITGFTRESPKTSGKG